MIQLLKRKQFEHTFHQT